MELKQFQISEQEERENNLQAAPNVLNQGATRNKTWFDKMFGYFRPKYNAALEAIETYLNEESFGPDNIKQGPYITIVRNGQTITIIGTGGGDIPGGDGMPRNIYDPRGESRDIFLYTDNKRSILYFKILSTDWVGDVSPFTFSLEYDDILSTDTPHVSVNYPDISSFAGYDEWLSEKNKLDGGFSLIDVGITSDGKLTFYCSKKPEIDIPVQAEFLHKGQVLDLPITEVV